LGKAGHFRKSGVPVPAHIHFGDLFRLSALIDRYKPTEVVFLGDLFHSDYNQDWEFFCDWLQQYPAIEFILIRGNHDILYKTDYLNAGIRLVDILEYEPFSFTHEKEPSGLYNFSGHLHPSVRLRGVARQSLNLPCFYFSNDHALLPAFGTFTGYVAIEPARTDRVFVVAEQQVIKV
ncbi:MAG: ligase-associated DNA damage response endonuclease PdeM, partial [Bacteroidota bacterium]